MTIYASALHSADGHCRKNSGKVMPVEMIMITSDNNPHQCLNSMEGKLGNRTSYKKEFAKALNKVCTTLIAIAFNHKNNLFFVHNYHVSCFPSIN